MRASRLGTEPSLAPNDLAPDIIRASQPITVRYLNIRQILRSYVVQGPAYNLTARHGVAVEIEVGHYGIPDATRGARAEGFGGQLDQAILI